MTLTLDLSEDDAMELFRLVGSRPFTERWSGELYARLGTALADRRADEANDARFAG